MHLPSKPASRLRVDLVLRERPRKTPYFTTESHPNEFREEKRARVARTEDTHAGQYTECCHSQYNIHRLKLLIVPALEFLIYDGVNN